MRGPQDEIIADEARYAISERANVNLEKFSSAFESSLMHNSSQRHHLNSQFVMFQIRFAAENLFAAKFIQMKC
jgi:hypothetical protein